MIHVLFVKVLFSIIWVTYLALLGVFVKQPDMANPHDFYRGISPPRFSESSKRFHQLDRSEEKWHGLAGISAGFSIACFFCLLLLLWLCLYLCLCLRIQSWDEYEITWDQTRPAQNTSTPLAVGESTWYCFYFSICRCNVDLFTRASNRAGDFRCISIKCSWNHWLF